MCVILMLLCGLVGLLIYEKYHDCDPLNSKRVTRSDQVIRICLLMNERNLLVLSIIRDGNLQRIARSYWTFHCCYYEWFIEVIRQLLLFDSIYVNFSSISSGVNSITAVIMEDVWKPLTPKQPMSDERQTKISKYMCKKQ